MIVDCCISAFFCFPSLLLFPFCSRPLREENAPLGGAALSLFGDGRLFLSRQERVGDQCILQVAMLSRRCQRKSKRTKVTYARRTGRSRRRKEERTRRPGRAKKGKCVQLEMATGSDRQDTTRQGFILDGADSQGYKMGLSRGKEEVGTTRERKGREG